MIKHETFPAGQQVPRVGYARPNKANRKMMIVSERFLVSSYLKAGVSFFCFLLFLVPPVCIDRLVSYLSIIKQYTEGVGYTPWQRWPVFLNGVEI